MTRETMDIHVVTNKWFDSFTEENETSPGFKYEPVGLFMFRDNNMYVGVDNSTGDAWTESFNNMKECIDWLRGLTSAVD